MQNNKEYNEYKIVIIGAGGTGGAIASQLARFLYSKKDDDTKKFRMVLVDGDHVDEKNINRQPFASEDVGMFKVDCLQEAYYETYGIDVRSVPEFIDDVESFKKNIMEEHRPQFSSYYKAKMHLILIGAVDNHRARQTMHKYFESVELTKGTDLLYIDSANEFDFGTVVAGYKDSNGVILSPDRAFFFPDILKSRQKKASELSCGAVNISAPQHYATNQQAACIVFSQLCSFIEYGTYLDGVTYFHSFKCSINNRPLEDFLKDSYKKFGVNDYPSLIAAMKEVGDNEKNKQKRNRRKAERA